MKSLFSLLICLSLGSLSAQPEIVDGVVAVVGNNIVLKSDIEQQFENLRNQGVVTDESQKCRIFEDLLFEKLLLHQAELDSIIVGDEEVEQTIQRRIDVFIQQFRSQQKLEQYYNKTVVEIKEEMRPYVKDQLTAQKMLREVTGETEITPSEVREFYNSLPEDSIPLINTLMEYARIIKYPEVSDEAKLEVINKLKEYKKRVEEGTSSFSTLAILYSQDPGSAKNGGEYIGIKRGQFVKEFEAVAFNLKNGEISDPFRTEYGYHIVQLEKRRGEELDLRHILLKPQISVENLEKSQQFLDSIKQLIISDKLSFEEAARRFSDDENTRLNAGIVMNPQTGDSRWETGQLEKTAFYALDKIGVGEISEPVFFRTQEEKEGYQLFKLLSKTPAHKADLTSDYQVIKNTALQHKNQKATNKWIEEKLKTTYVRVNNEYFNCDFERSWIKRSQYID